MQQIHENDEHLRIYFDRQSLPLTPRPNKVLRLIVEHGLHTPHRIIVKKSGGNYEARGIVDSEWVHDLVLTMIPPYARRDMIDHITVEATEDDKPLLN